MFQYEANVIRIVDGDTLLLDVDLGFTLRLKVRVRLARVQAPELANWAADGLHNPAIDWLNEVIPPGSVVVVDIMKTEKYGRWLGTLRYKRGSTSRDDILRAGVVLNDELVSKGFAKKYTS